MAEPHATYTGETRFPLIIQNTHRYFFYIAAIMETWRSEHDYPLCTFRSLDDFKLNGRPPMTRAQLSSWSSACARCFQTSAPSSFATRTSASSFSASAC